MNDRKEEQESITSLLSTFVRERIESPFFMAYIITWAAYNRDFLFYLFLSDEANKVFNLTWWIWEWDKFTIPLLISLGIGMFFTPINHILASARYWILNYSIEIVEKQKKSYDLKVKQFNLIDEIEKLESELVELINKKQTLDGDIKSTEDRYAHIKGNIDQALELAIYKLQVESIEFFNQSRDKKPKETINNDGKIRPNTILRYKVNGLERREENSFEFLRTLRREGGENILKALANSNFYVDAVMSASINGDIYSEFELVDVEL